MRLYVWNNPYGVTYGASVAYAVAASEGEARELVRQSRVSQYGYPPNSTALCEDIDRPADRVQDLPYAEIYEWSE